MNEKRKVTVYIKEEVWMEFLRKILEKHGKAAGGVISEETQNAIEQWLKKI